MFMDHTESILKTTQNNSSTPSGELKVESLSLKLTLVILLTCVLSNWLLLRSIEIILTEYQDLSLLMSWPISSKSVNRGEEFSGKPPDLAESLTLHSWQEASDQAISQTL